MAQEGTSAEHTDAGLMCPCSSLTTKELQQNWREEKRRERPHWLLFELPSYRVRETAFSKHVVYDVVIMRSGSFDSHRVSIERRYSDFAKLHQTLLQEFQEELDEILLPRKILTGNFNPECLLERRIALQDYIAKLYAKRCVRHSEHFANFFTDQEMKKAHNLLRAGQFTQCLALLQLVLEIQEKLAPWQSSTLSVHTLAALAVCHRDLEQPEQAYEAAHRALPVVRRYRLTVKEYHAPLLQMLVDLGYSLGRPVGQMQEELMALREAERGRVDTRSLKEIVVHKFV
ncbi:sorting nexin-20 [Periophthalmus magnuspinnatus]|uniref:sorting nexin-20 n=1 Tax=Periophthalmus magnuspinnatus TaxID=409849 RepID=UPI00145B8961|nr:sorting nexin-20 [Periophthalmus magnuspinnatus]